MHGFPYKQFLCSYSCWPLHIVSWHQHLHEYANRADRTGLSSSSEFLAWLFFCKPMTVLKDLPPKKRKSLRSCVREICSLETWSLWRVVPCETDHPNRLEITPLMVDSESDYWVGQCNVQSHPADRAIQSRLQHPSILPVTWNLSHKYSEIIPRISEIV